MRTTNNFLVVLRIIFNTSIENYFFIVLIIRDAQECIKVAFFLTRLGAQSL